MSAPHIPVLLDEVIAALAPAPGSLIVDATFGAGGYTRRLLDAGATVHAFDRDPDAIAAGSAWPETREDPPRLVLHARRFSEMVAALAEVGIARAGDSWQWRGRRQQREPGAVRNNNAFAELAKLKR